MKKYAIQINNRTLTIVEGQIERATFNFLASVLAASFIAYVLFVGMTILNIVDRKNLGNENAALKSRVTDLELSYLSETKKIDLNMAYSKGFKDAATIAFVGNKAPEKALTLANNE